MKKIVIKKLVVKEVEKQYLPITFEIKEDVDRIQINYQYEKDIRLIKEKTELSYPQATIDFSISGPDEMYLGSAGSNRSDFYFSKRTSSIGFMNPEKMKGIWMILVGAYHIPEEGVEVVYTIQIYPKKRQLLRGDTHTHTQASDGKLTQQTLVQQAEDMELDFLFITDHNNYASRDLQLLSKNVTLIPGMEWTQYKGHAGFLGVEQPFSGSFVTTNLIETKDKMNEVQQNRALIVLNHPFCPHCPWEWGFDVPFDAIEVWNGGLSDEANELAVQWWHEQLLQGKQIPIIGGSDFHSPNGNGPIGCPTTYLYSDSRNPDDILQAMKNGAGFIVSDTDAPIIQIDCQDFTFGDTIPCDIPLKLSLKHLKGDEELRIITNKETFTISMQSNQTAFNWMNEIQEITFLRVELWKTYFYKNQRVERRILLTNPIYFKN